jgi:hypothetical protein
MKTVNRGLRLGVSTHFHETESFATTRVPVGDHLSALYATVLREQLLKVRAVRAVCEVPDIQFLAHHRTPETGRHNEND